MQRATCVLVENRSESAHGGVREIACDKIWSYMYLGGTQARACARGVEGGRG